MLDSYKGTPEEELLAYYQSRKDLYEAYRPHDNKYFEGAISGIENTLKILGIKIEGINGGDV